MDENCEEREPLVQNAGPAVLFKSSSWHFGCLPLFLFPSLGYHSEMVFVHFPFLSLNLSHANKREKKSIQHPLSQPTAGGGVARRGALPEANQLDVFTAGPRRVVGAGHEASG
ncbi:hypothetical protein EVAR_54585_1 [Eumeta japonica]|uniref:Uncharacterized protein n=1 Tax=Eumeta variegata TaxID=151549 RepID=A0A4C1YP08_EUMVA|nr:hypothetical protein EVAR_54585_1 [Eumeta japonica]